MSATIDDNGEPTSALLSTISAEAPHGYIIFTCMRLENGAKGRALIVGAREYRAHPKLPMAEILTGLDFDGTGIISFIANTENDGRSATAERKIYDWAFWTTLKSSALRINVGDETALVNVSGSAAGVDAFEHFCKIVLR